MIDRILSGEWSKWAGLQLLIDLLEDSDVSVFLGAHISFQIKRTSSALDGSDLSFFPFFFFFPDPAPFLLKSPPFCRSRVNSSCRSSTWRCSSTTSPFVSSPESRDTERFRPGAEPGVAEEGALEDSSRMES